MIRNSLIALVLTAAVASAADWTGFRGPNGAAVSDDKNLPAKFSPTENVRWKVDLPGRGLSNPVITNGKVYVTACSGFKQRRLHVLCFEEATGKKLWERQFTATGNTNCHPTSNMAAPSPTTDGKAVYCLWASADLAALELDGTLRWYRSLVGDYPDITNQVGMASSPVVHDGVLLLPMENAGESFAAGLDVKSGKNLWKVPRQRGINWITPIVIEHEGKPAAVFYNGKEISAYEPATGKLVWTFTDRGGSDILSPTRGEGLLFIPGGELIALKANKDGPTPEVAWKTNKLGGAAGASPVYLDGKLYGMTSVGLRCLDAKDGKELWLQRVTGKCWASPVLADGKAYVTTETGKVSVIKLGNEPELLAENDMGQAILATPAIANGAIYLRSDKTLFCIAAKK